MKVTRPARLAAPLLFLLNMANPIQPGEPVGEPSGALAGIAVERETLRLDLRPLAAAEPAIVEASYDLRHEGRGRRRIDLLFVATALDGDGAVSMDGEPVAAASGEALELPEAWRAPPTTPPIGAGEPLLYELEGQGAVRFSLSLPPGSHRVRVRYRAMPSAHSGDAPTRYWQLGYVLAPARQWARFGGLQVEVLLPPGWRAASEPALDRAGDALSGSWDDVPADALALTVQAPPPASWPYALLIVAVLAGGLALCAVLGALLGRWLGRRGRSSAWALPLAFVLPCLWLFAVIPSFLVYPQAIQRSAGAQAAWTYRSGLPYALLLVAPLVGFVGFLATQLAAFLARRRAAGTWDAAGPREPGPPAG